MSSLNENFAYIGSELTVFAAATRWRAYWQHQVEPFLGSQVLEVGAGLGNVTRSLCGPQVKRWLALEPDRHMAMQLTQATLLGHLPACCEARCGTTSDLAASELFDTVLYTDVLEHIEDDRAEVARATTHLPLHGHLVVLVPAHQALYTPFDAAIGHFRRYSLRQLLAVAGPHMEPRLARYLDSAGMLASLANRLLLRSAHPTAAQIRLWDNWMVPLSRRLDPLLFYRCGKSALVVWQKT